METYLQAGLEALGDPTRLAILQRLARRPLAVRELADGFPVSRPAVSQHLRVLKSVHLVTDRKMGTQRIYEVNPEGVELLRVHFDRLWKQTLAAFKTAAEQSKKEKHHGRANARGSARKKRRRPQYLKS